MFYIPDFDVDGFTVVEVLESPGTVTQAHATNDDSTLIQQQQSRSLS